MEGDLFIMACEVQRFLGCLLNPESNKANSAEVINIIVSGKPCAINVCENCASMDRPEVLCVTVVM